LSPRPEHRSPGPMGLDTAVANTHSASHQCSL
jgi:hypothetical protein